jgi:hypothetical protein
MGRKFCNSIYQLETAFRIMCNKKSLSGVPVFFVEPRYGNRNEIKVVLAENDVSGASLPPFFSMNHIKRASDFKPFTGNYDLFDFAKRVKQELQGSGACVSAPLLRIDIFETQTLTLVVNEVESLEACTQFSGQVQPDGRRGTHVNDDRMSAFRETFWVSKTRQLLLNGLSRYF